MLLQKLCVPTGGDVPLHHGQILEANVDMDKHVGIPGCPVSRIGALRELMPYHAGGSILVFGDEGKRLPRSVVSACIHQCLDSDEAIAAKKPCVLRPAASARGAVAGDQ